MLLGRERELALVRGHVEASTPLVVLGEAGVGKTALVRAAVASLGRPLREGGGFATLSWMPLLALSRAVGRPLAEGDAAFVAREVEAEIGSDFLFVDDCQWVDPLTREALAALAGRIRVVAAVRAGEQGADDALAALRGFEQLELAPLERPVAAELAGRTAPELPPHVVERIVDVAGGNPFLIEQLAATGEVTDSVRLAVAARLRPLGPAAREAMSRLALLGRPVEQDLIGPGADELVRARLATREGATIAARHALLAEAALESVAADERARLHALLARELRDPGEAARHHLAAGEHVAAVAKARAAADAAETPGERAEHLRVAAVAAGNDGAALRLEAATALHDARRLDDLEQVLDGLELDEPEQRAHAAYLRASLAIERANPAGAEAAIAEGLSYATPADSAAEVRLLHAAAQRAFWLDNDFEEAQRLSRRAYELGRERRVDEARLLGMVGATLGAGPQADADAAARALREAAEIARRDGDHQTELKAGYNRFLVGAAETYDYGQRAVAEALLARAHELRLTMFEHAFQTLVGRYDFHYGEYRRAVEELEPLVEEALHPQQLWLARTWLTLSLVELGELARAEAQVAAMEHDPPVRTVKPVTVAWLRAEVAFAAGQVREALAAADAALADPNAGGGGFALPPALVRAWAAYELGLDATTPVADASGPHQPDIRAAQAELHAVSALSRGAHDDAARAFEAALPLWRVSNIRGELRCAWALGEIARLRGDLDEAVARLEAVEAEAVRREMTTLLARTRRALRRAGARRGAQRGSRGALSAREHEVLELVGAGLTNAAIAARLGLAVPTVERQIASAARKLGARNRTQAAVFAREA